MTTILTERDVEMLLLPGADPFLKHCAYNALDCCTPREISDLLEERLDEDQRRIYQFEHFCQGPALTMTLRGVLIDQGAREAAINDYEEIETHAEDEINRLAAEIWDGRELRIGRCIDADGNRHRGHLWPPRVNPNENTCRRCGQSRIRKSRINLSSSQQLCHLFYNLWGCKVQKARDTGKPTVDKEALEAIRGEAVELGNKDIASAAHHAILGKGARKQVGYLRSKCGADGRMRSSITVGAAETGRWSANKAPDWTGWNIQQIADRIRHTVIADTGLELGYADLEQAESYIVAYDSGDEGYIAAHATGDVHTYVCRLMWPSLEWTGDLKLDRVIADVPPEFDPYHSRRDYGKRFQHGGNMGRSPGGVARQIHIPVREAEEAYARMYGGQKHFPEIHGAFPRIKLRHAEVWAEIQRTGVTVSCLGRRRQFLGRTWDASTLREALGQLEQSPVADILNLALCRVWAELDTRVNVWDAPHPSQPNRVWLLAQVHDAILFLYRPGDTDTLRRVKELMEIPLLINGRTLTIPVEIMVGPNWSKTAMQKVKL
jgi:DNA polymerase I-like protein with 3'-5' exonuclease and polymerase domains